MPLPQAYNKLAPPLVKLHPYDKFQEAKRLKTSTKEVPLLVSHALATPGVVPSTADPRAYSNVERTSHHQTPQPVGPQRFGNEEDYENASRN